jgi:hypothetical protein
MTSMTWTTFTPAATAPIAGVITMPAFATKLARFAAIFLGVNADKDDHFRGLDLNGNAMWSTRH